MKVNINPSWGEILKEEFEKPYFSILVDFVRREYSIKHCYPPGGLIFNAFNQCSFDDTKVIIIGQDPYVGAGQANGLCFSVSEGTPLPPSLKNIYKEIESDMGIQMSSTNGDLSKWANQGVLLLNATLTVEEAKVGSHQNKGWEEFTDAVINIISRDKKNCVFLLWGSYAQKKAAYVNKSKHCILKAAHPSPLSANKGFFGCRHFSKTNLYLSEHNINTIDWQI